MNEAKARNWIEVGKAAEWPENGGRLVTVAGRRISVFHHQQEWYALTESCPHAGVSLTRGPLKDHMVMCPGHGWRFSLKTGEMAGYSGSGFSLATYPVRVTDAGAVEIGV